jgi:hypothetical protein
LESRLNEYDRCTSGVAFGEEIITEMAMFSLDVPLSKRFCPCAINIFRERFNRVMTSHSEFIQLCDADQKLHLQNSLFPALAINFARGETCASGSDQFEFFGQMDAKHFLETFGRQIGVAKLKKIDIASINTTLGGALDDGTTKKYVGYARRLKALVQEPIMLKVRNRTLFYFVRL